MKEELIETAALWRMQMDFVRFYNCWNGKTMLPCVFALALQQADILDSSRYHAEFRNAYTAQAFVFCDKPAADAELVVVAFRGTRPFDAAGWCADLDPSWYKIPRLGRAHAAYTHALGAQRNIGWPKWVEHIKGKPQKVRYWIASSVVVYTTPRSTCTHAGDADR